MLVYIGSVTEKKWKRGGFRQSTQTPVPAYEQLACSTARMRAASLPCTHPHVVAVLSSFFAAC